MFFLFCLLQIKKCYFLLILSRCMKIYFAPLKNDDVATILQEKLDIDSKKAHVIARLSGVA